APNIFLSHRGEKAISKSWADFAEEQTLLREGGQQQKRKNLGVVKERRKQWITGETQLTSARQAKLKSVLSLFNQYSVSASLLQQSLGVDKPRLRVGYLISDYAKYSTILMRK